MATAQEAPLLSVEGLSKHYGAVRALRNLSFTLNAGEVLGILGDNGAGKSTLVGILSGTVHASSGTLRLRGEPLEAHSVAAAHALGVETVYQDLALANDLAVWQNVFLGAEKTTGGLLGRAGWLDRDAMRDGARQAVATTGIKIPSIDELCGDLSGGQRQTTAVATAVEWAQTMLLLDEPTSALGPHETSCVNDLVRSAATRGIGVLLVTQDLAQMQEVCDRSIVLRRGELAVEVARDELPATELIAYITGARKGKGTSGPRASVAPEKVQDRARVAVTPVANRGKRSWVQSKLVLRGEGLTKLYGSVTALADVDLELRSGEILGLCGHNGAGKSTLVGILSGTIHPTRGRLFIDGEERVIHSPLDARAAGIETVYQDLALAPELNGWENVFLGEERLRGGLLGKLGWLDRQAMAAETHVGVTDMGIDVGSVDRPIGELSGGRRQALAIARARMRGRSVVLFDEPTSALGVEEQDNVNALLRSLADQGMAVLLISHDLPKAHAICDRIVILRLGRRVAEVDPANTDLDDLVAQVVSEE